MDFRFPKLTNPESPILYRRSQRRDAGGKIDVANRDLTLLEMKGVEQ